MRPAQTGNMAAVPHPEMATMWPLTLTKYSPNSDRTLPRARGVYQPHIWQSTGGVFEDADSSRVLPGKFCQSRSEFLQSR